MARPLRIEYDGALYHITSRGNARKPIYKDDEDRKAFLDTLNNVKKRYNWICHAYNGYLRTTPRFILTSPIRL